MSVELADCKHCGKQLPLAQMKRCTRCKDALYCGRECQSSDWSVHKLTCQVIIDGRAPAASPASASPASASGKASGSGSRSAGTGSRTEAAQSESSGGSLALFGVGVVIAAAAAVAGYFVLKRNT